MDVNSRDPLQNIIPFRIKGVEIGRFDSSGNLKIGTTTTLAPTVRLDISGGAARVNSGAAASTALTTTGRIGVNTATPTVELDVSGAVNITASSAVAYALTTKGRIGINTAAPASDLDVNGAVVMRSTLLLNNSLTLPTGFWHKSNDNVERLQYITSGNTVFKSGSGFLWYDSNNAVRMFLSNSGLLGIGPSAAPGANLDVTGVSRMTASSATATALTTTGRIGVNMAAPTVSLDVSGAANVSTYLSVGSGSSSSVTTTSNLPNAFYVRIGNGSNWRDYIPLLVADSTTNIQTWGYPDTQWFSGSVQNEIAQQFSYFAGYWLNANRAVIGTSFSVESFAILSGFATPSTRGIFTFTATAVSNGVVTAYKATLSLGNHGEQQLTAQQDGIDAGVARRLLSNPNRTLLMGGSVETGYLGVLGAARLTASSATATALTTTGRIGVNTATPTVDLEVNGLAKLGNVNIVPLYVFTSHTFTNAGATGRLGPTLTTVRNHSDYASVNWAQNNSYLSMTSDNGIQLWTVPISGNYTIRAKGAAGLNTIGGKGRDIQLTTTLIKGEVIRILVGQQGTVSSGGGGTFVVRGTDTPIIVAGGGGGRGTVMTYPNQEPFSDANIGTQGKGTPYGYSGGSDGGGGISGGAGGIPSQAAGGGFYGNGGSGGGVSFTSGGAGGQGTNNGGFGGGGADLNHPGGAGGGGYSGGGAGGNIQGKPNGVYLTYDHLGGGGGGSYGITTLTDFGAINTGHGSVTITLTTPSVALEVVGVAVVTGSSATATALTTTGRIGVNTAAPSVDLEVNGLAKLGNVNIVPLYVFTSHTFTNAGATGRLGPTLTTVRNHSDYASVNWAQNNSYLSMTSDNGIQLWTVPISGNYTIRAKGAAGLDTRGGKGRDIQLTTTLIKGEVIRILVGQQGTGASSDNYSSGGGGTFVVRGTDTPIIIAGGGGGRGDVIVYGIYRFTDAVIGTTGNHVPNGWGGGSEGGGGIAPDQGGGGGFNINNSPQPKGGVSFTSGGFGGQGTIDGGFGGGGAYLSYVHSGGGGGGGYSGGAGGGLVYGDPLGTGNGNYYMGGGGGGSYGITTLTDFGAINTGHGSVLITLTTPSVALEVVGVAVVTGSSATATALTTTGRIGVNTAAPAVDLDVNGIMRSNTGLKLGNAATTAMTGSNSTLDVENTGRARARFTSGTNIFTIGTHSNTSTPSESFIYNETSTPMTFGTSGNERMRITADGKVGIGTNTPLYPLDIVGVTNTSTSVVGKWFGTSSPANTILSNDVVGVPISMRLNGAVWIESTTTWVGFWVASDRRIKKNINYNISSECLNLFRQLKCSNYSYIDERANKTNVYGYIAQDVSTVIPYAVTTQKGFIPSLYSLAKMSKENGIVKLTCSEQKPYTFHSLHDNQGKAFINDNNEPASDNDGGRHFKVKLFDVSMNEYIVRINEILDNGVFTIENDDVSIKLTNEEYFVFGQEIDDYKILNNEAIAIVATAALQEVDRQQQADKARIAELEATVATQQSLINDILERLNKSGL